MKVRNKKGFTILEMMAVVSIMSILLVLYFWYTRGTFVMGKNVLIDNWVGALNQQAELYKISNIETGGAGTTNWRNVEEALQVCSANVDSEKGISSENKEINHQYMSSVGWDVTKQKFYRKYEYEKK